MKLAISQIAWAATAEAETLALLQQSGLTQIEVVPARLKTAQPLWQRYKLQPVAIQSLLFGQPDWNLFDDSRYDLLTYVQGLIRAADKAKIKNLIFGSPKNRWIPEGMSAATAQKKAKQVFLELGGMAAEHDLYICLEPNPKEYNCNFLTTTAEVIEFLEFVNKSHLKLNLDLGTMQLNHENPREIIPAAQKYLQHVHISEPYLAPVAKLTDFHFTVAETLRAIQYDKTCSIEMKPVSEDAQKNLTAITQTLTAVQKVFGD